ncbi:TonB-dependent receptor plug domain-containing protein [Falsiroseomonas tokyonensis]|uniref:TonB-dependent receptor plug domain-containing protein n=1 Tax=Falsiroseomonas tokyonensis TaxID=430521 RepID=A0ABV7BV38_9PROT|nr:TonB-dependent receptor [Falsiroseomonas tokyonensis]MBU8538496.1 TonB-dependent receptor [Falsiroseomonas tokyonensis]
MRLNHAFRAAPFALALPLLLPTFATAQQAIPETIVTATRIPTEAERVPAAITVLTRQDIEERGYQTLSEALATVPGMNLVQAGGLGQQASIFVRGTASRHVLVLLDGVPVNDPSEPNGAFNFGNELLGDIERIEVVRGPGSSLYGSGAIGGVINLVTRRAPAGVPLQVFGDLAGGSQGTARGALGAAGSLQGWNYLVVGQGLTTQGSDATPRRMNNDTKETESLRAGAGTARFGWAGGSTSVEGLLRWRENRLELDNVPNDDPNYEGNDRRWFGQLRAETGLFDGIWTTGLRAAVTEDRRRYLNLPDSRSSASTDDLYRGQRQTLDWGNRIRLGDLGPFSMAGLAFGVTHEHESVEANSGSPGFRTTTDASANSTALHAGLQARLGPRLDLSAGLRRDSADDYDGFTSWRLGTVLALPEVASRLHASAGTAFKAPSLYQRFGRIGSFFRGNPNLEAEDSFAWEIGAETDLPLFGRSDGATASATYFNTRTNNLINFNRSFSSLENIEKASSQGVELALTARPFRWLDARLGWTITEARDEVTDAPLARRPRNVVSAGARIAPTDRIVISPEVLFTGPSPDTASYDNAGRFISGVNYNKSGTVLNLTASYRVTPAITTYVEGRNLGNSRWEPANGFVTPGRSLLVGTRFVF